MIWWWFSADVLQKYTCIHFVTHYRKRSDSFHCSLFRYCAYLNEMATRTLSVLSALDVSVLTYTAALCTSDLHNDSDLTSAWEQEYVSDECKQCSFKWFCLYNSTSDTISCCILCHSNWRWQPPLNILNLYYYISFHGQQSSICRLDSWIVHEGMWEYKLYIIRILNKSIFSFEQMMNTPASKRWLSLHFAACTGA